MTASLFLSAALKTALAKHKKLPIPKEAKE